MSKLSTAFLMAISIAFVSVPLQAEVSVPHTFSAGKPAVADEVNKNFDALVTALNSALARIEALETENQNLASKVAEIESNKALDLANYVEVLEGPEVHGYTTVRFTGVNFQVVDGTGVTAKSHDKANGLGNLIVGYNEAGGIEMCDRQGSIMTQSHCEDSGHTWGATHKTGSHNLVVGSSHNYAGSAGLVAGYKNGITGMGSSVLGGRVNAAIQSYTSIIGGRDNRATDVGAVIVGGEGNLAHGSDAVIVGGQANELIRPHAVVVGGQRNHVQGDGAVIVGGRDNIANGLNSVVLGGVENWSAQDEKISPHPVNDSFHWE